jgi:hypothetical protein
MATGGLPMRDFSQILGQLQAETTLVMNYFAGFSRFEFALINSGIIQNPAQGTQHHLTADWIAFAVRIEPHFDYQRTQELRDAVAYLEGHPPNRLSRVNGVLSWVRNDDADNKTRLGRLAVHVKTIRNNLFHGGKYPNTPELPAERDAQLLRCGIVMLEEFLVQSATDAPDIPRLFDQTLPPPGANP